MVRALLTAGPTREPIDPVRFLSNASSGRQAAALAAEMLGRGWELDVVHGPLEVALPPGAALHPVRTADEMLAECLRIHPACDVVIGAAAVSDYRPSKPLRAKRRRSQSRWILELVPTPDVLAELGKLKGRRVHVGFALESEDLLENSSRKLHEKNLDIIVANSLEAIGADAGRYYLLLRDGTVRDLGRIAKTELARLLIDEVAALLSYRHEPPAAPV